MLQILSYLPYLACPLMILVCMGALRRPGGRDVTGMTVDQQVKQPATRSSCCDSSAVGDAVTPLPLTAKSNRADELARLKVEHRELGRRIDRLLAEEANHEDSAEPRRVAGA
jgi:hypothetical protein